MPGKWKEVVRLHFKGRRFKDHALDLSALKELQHFQKMVEDTAEALWRAANPERERIPKNFKDRTRLCLRQIEDGSAATPLEIYIEEEPQQALWVEEPGELKEAVDLAMEVFKAAHSEEPLPERFPKKLLNEYALWGRSLSEEESLEMTKPEHAPVAVSPGAREHLSALADAPYEDALEVTGQVLEADVHRKTFQLWLDDKRNVRVAFNPEQESLITTALKDYQSVRLEIRGRGLYSAQGILQAVSQVSGIQYVEVGPPCFDATAPQIEDVILAISKQIPDEEWNKVPSDLSEDLDRYIYGVAEE